MSRASELPTPREEEERVGFGTIALYASPVAVVLYATSLISFYFLKFATDVLLVAPAVVGTILLIGRLWDAVSDPVVGRMSDRTRTRWGRRRPWFAASALPLAVSVVALWSPPTSLDDAALRAWLLIAFLAYLTFFTTFRVPHLALGAELSRGYHDRTRVFGGVQILETVGLISAAATIGVIENAADPRAAAAGLSMGIAAAIAVVLIVTAAAMRERSEFQQRDEQGSRRVFGDVLRNPHARLLLLVFFFDQTGFTMTIASLPYLTDYVLGSRGNTGLFMAAAVLSLMVGIPGWILLSHRFGKRRVWMAALAAKLVALAGLFSVSSGGENDWRLLFFGVISVGLFSGPSTVIGPSLKADVVDWDEARSGERREGAYFATWNFAAKSAAALGGWTIGMVLAGIGFVPNETQSEAALFGIRALATIAPAALHTVALLAVARFALDEAGHAEARAQARARDAERVG